MKQDKPKKPTPQEALDFIKQVVSKSNLLPLVAPDDGLRRYDQLQVAARLSDLGFNDFDSISVLRNHDMCASLDFLAHFQPDNPLSLKWTSLKQAGIVPARRGQGRGNTAGRNSIAIMLVDFLRTTGIKPTRSRHSRHNDSGCDIVAKALQESGLAWATSDAIRNAWDNRPR